MVMKKFLLPEHLIRLFGPLLLVAALLLALPAKAANTFQAAASLPEVRSNFTATLLNNGKILVAGGSGSGAVALKTAALYD
ncbi:MAG: hypothetical protein JWO82_1223, partial [Akkermansiaceae bacterium]|nr:hypothetical protein [Akkermansiaceae bacterium]